MAQITVHRRVIDLDEIPSLSEGDYDTLLSFCSQWADSDSHPEWRKTVEKYRTPKEDRIKKAKAED